jgi:hypothetical protein
MRLLVSLGLAFSLAAVACTLDEGGSGPAGDDSGSEGAPDTCEETAATAAACDGPHRTCGDGQCWDWECCYKDHGEWQINYFECFSCSEGDAGVPPDGRILDAL